jgi:hypothetical protein
MGAQPRQLHEGQLALVGQLTQTDGAGPCVIRTVATLPSGR